MIRTTFTAAVLVVLIAGVAFVTGGVASADPGGASCEHASDVARTRSGVLAARCASTPTTYVEDRTGIVPAGVATTRVGLNCNPGDSVVSVSAFTLSDGLQFFGFSVTPTTGDPADPSVEHTWNPPVPSSGGELYATVGGAAVAASYRFTLTCQVAG